MARPELIGQTFVALADTLVDAFDLVDFLHGLTSRCVDVLGIAEAGILLAGTGGKLQVLASSSERMRAVELLEVQRSSGPCSDAFGSGDVVREDDLASTLDRWPGFGSAAVAAGFRSVYAIPMRLRSERIGALNLFADRVDGLSTGDEALAQALADVATIGIIHARTVEAQEALTEQLSAALNSRIVIEQAKGVLAEQANVDIDDAFESMRRHARSTNRRLADVAADVVARRLSSVDLSS